MSSTLQLPSAVALPVREGAIATLRELGAELADAVNDRAAYGSLHERLQATWSLLDTIGWQPGGEGPVDVREHGPTLLAALDTILPGLAQWLGEMRAEFAEREAACAEEYEAVREFEGLLRRRLAALEHVPGTIAVPGVLVGRLRQGAYQLLGAGGEALDNAATRGQPPTSDSIQQLHGTLALLDRIGWSTDADTGVMIELDIREHGRTLLAALEDLLPLLARWVEEVKPSDPSKPARADELRLLQQFASLARRAVTS
jgi:hypothetical protein